MSDARCVTLPLWCDVNRSQLARYASCPSADIIETLTLQASLSGTSLQKGRKDVVNQRLEFARHCTYS